MPYDHTKPYKFVPQVDAWGKDWAIERLIEREKDLLSFHLWEINEWKQPADGVRLWWLHRFNMMDLYIDWILEHHRPETREGKLTYNFAQDNPDYVQQWLRTWIEKNPQKVKSNG